MRPHHTNYYNCERPEFGDATGQCEGPSVKSGPGASVNSVNQLPRFTVEPFQVSQKAAPPGGQTAAPRMAVLLGSCSLVPNCTFPYLLPGVHAVKTTKTSPLRGALSHGVSQKSKSLEASQPPTPRACLGYRR